MDPHLLPDLNQELGDASEWARYYDYHGRTDLAREYHRQVANLKAVIKRVQLIDGLRALADFLDDHPEVPVNGWATVSYSVTGADITARVAACLGVPAPDVTLGDSDLETVKRAEVDRVAALLGVTPEFRADGAHYVAERCFGPVEYRAAAITDDHMAKVHAADTYQGEVGP